MIGPTNGNVDSQHFKRSREEEDNSSNKKTTNGIGDYQRDKRSREVGDSSNKKIKKLSHLELCGRDVLGVISSFLDVKDTLNFEVTCPECYESSGPSWVDKFINLKSHALKFSFAPSIKYDFIFSKIFYEMQIPHIYDIEKINRNCTALFKRFPEFKIYFDLLFKKEFKEGDCSGDARLQFLIKKNCFDKSLKDEYKNELYSLAEDLVVNHHQKNMNHSLWGLKEDKFSIKTCLDFAQKGDDSFLRIYFDLNQYDYDETPLVSYTTSFFPDDDFVRARLNESIDLYEKGFKYPPILHALFIVKSIEITELFDDNFTSTLKIENKLRDYLSFIDEAMQFCNNYDDQFFVEQIITKYDEFMNRNISMESKCNILLRAIQITMNNQKQLLSLKDFESERCYLIHKLNQFFVQNKDKVDFNKQFNVYCKENPTFSNVFSDFFKTWPMFYLKPYKNFKIRLIHAHLHMKITYSKCSMH